MFKTLLLACLVGLTVTKPTYVKRDLPENGHQGFLNPSSSITETRKSSVAEISDTCLDDSGYPISTDPFEKDGDCLNFYQCSNGYLYTMPCAPGTAFNPNIGVCDWPYNVDGCGDGTGNGDEDATLPPFNDECLDTSGHPVSGDPFEKPGDCDHFYQCSNGYLYAMPCAPETVFNPAIGVCDHPWNVPGCGGITTTAPAPTTTQSPLPPFDPECLGDDGIPVSGNPFEKPGDCDHYYQCSNGYLHTKPCADGTVFNPAIGVCDWPHNVLGCGANPPTTDAPAPPSTSTESSSSSYDDECLNDDGNPVSIPPFAKPGDCDQFYQCSNGYLHTKPCGPGTVFNPATGVCDWPHNVPECDDGSGGSGGSGETTTTPPTTPPPTAPQFDAKCLDDDGNPESGDPFEKPGDCDHFYQCSNGYLHTMPCADGTVFNPAMGVCDWPYNVPGCGGTTTTTAAATTTATQPPPPPFDPKCLDTDGNPVSSSPFEKPGDCDHFYQCSNGYLHTMPCAVGTVFNPEIGVCDWPYNVPGCGGTTTTTAAATTTATQPPPPPFDPECLDTDGHPVSGDPFEKPGDCDHFYQCSNGYLHTMPCADGTVFNPAMGVCDWPYNVPGCGGTTTTAAAAATTTTAQPPPPPFDPECLDTDGNPVSGNPFEKPGDCDHFYQCSNGYLHTMPCGPGTVFNPAIGVCDHPWNVPGCGGTTTTAAAPTTQPPPPEYDADCVDTNGYPISGDPYEKPNDCDHFYQCSNGYRYTMPCAPGTVFNPAIGVCDWPHNVPGCGGNGGNGGGGATTTESPTTAKPFDADCVDANGYPISGDPYEKPNDCDHFYQCSNGYRYTMPCGEGTAFNPAIGVCDWPHNVHGCGGNGGNGGGGATTTESPTTAKPFDADCVDANGYPISGDPYEKPNDCDHFYQCSNGYRYTMPCGEGTAFNPAIGVCDWPYNVPGCGVTAAPTTTTQSTHTTTPSCTGSHGEPLSTKPFEKPGDCSHFYQCGAGILYTMPCPKGTVFNPDKKVCDWPRNVPGC